MLEDIYSVFQFSLYNFPHLNATYDEVLLVLLGRKYLYKMQGEIQVPIGKALQLVNVKTLLKSSLESSKAAFNLSKIKNVRIADQGYPA